MHCRPDALAPVRRDPAPRAARRCRWVKTMCRGCTEATRGLVIAGGGGSAPPRPSGRRAARKVTCAVPAPCRSRQRRRRQVGGRRSLRLDQVGQHEPQESLELRLLGAREVGLGRAVAVMKAGARDNPARRDNLVKPYVSIETPDDGTLDVCATERTGGDGTRRLAPVRAVANAGLGRAELRSCEGAGVETRDALEAARSQGRKAAGTGVVRSDLATLDLAGQVIRGRDRLREPRATRPMSSGSRCVGRLARARGAC